MQARRKTGQYTRHNTPGDGTGMNRLPQHEDPVKILTDAHLAEPDGTDTTGGHQPYDCQVTTDEKE